MKAGNLPAAELQRDPGDEDDGNTAVEALWGHPQAQVGSGGYAGPQNGQVAPVTRTESEG